MKPEDIAALETFYNSIDIPKELQFSQAIKYIDLPKFVHNNLKLLKDGLLTGQGAKIRYDDLVDIKAVLETKNN